MPNDNALFWILLLATIGAVIAYVLAAASGVPSLLDGGVILLGWAL